MDSKKFDSLKERTKQFSLRVIKAIEDIPSNKTGNVIAQQLLRSATSVGANYRAACRAKSQADFIYKIQICEEECDERQFWIELLIESKIVKKNGTVFIMKHLN